METVIPGKSNPHAVTARVNLLKALEYTLSNGSSMIFECAQPGLCTGAPEELDTYCRDCDFVFNLAGVNRPQNPEEVMQGNFGFASTLLETLKK